MKLEKAIKILENSTQYYVPVSDLKALDMAIEALKEVQQYREIGTAEECREAVEKQKAKKPDIYTDTIQTMTASMERDVYLCPVCGQYICNIEDELPNYCDYCGQAIDENLEGMEDEEEDMEDE